MPRLEPPKGGVTVRMYRQGHGDCFLLAFPRQAVAVDKRPVYVLIDCGFKKGSPAFLADDRDIDQIVADIAVATDRHLDLVVVTHEHEDHVNGFWRRNDPPFAGFRIDEAWMAWTEDPGDDVANALRRKHGDVLVRLATARNRLAASPGAASTVRRIDALLASELGLDGAGPLGGPALAAAAKNPAGWTNKQAMKFVKDEAAKHRGTEFLRPGSAPRMVPGSGVRAFVLGPPRRPDLLADEDPVGREAFPRPGGGGHGLSFADALNDGAPTGTPFSGRHCVPLADAIANEPLFQRQYGTGDVRSDTPQAEVAGNAAWRRIDDEWLYSAESLALRMNEGVNNTSLVLAFELPESRKVLLFVGDAQRGNWISWVDHEWDDDGRTVDARDLLARTVLYKVGHHGSHNATLAGSTSDAHPNLAWMGHQELAAMIPAVNKWAMEQNDPPWVHPLPSIRRALLKQAQGRVLQTDIDKPRRPDYVTDETWEDFMGRTDFESLYFDYRIVDA
jgi:hypothetical protein